MPRTRHSVSHPTPHIAMRLRGILPTLLFGALLAGCNDLDLTNPNSPSTETFWQTDDDALAGINATYNGLMQNGVYGRWQSFAFDIRSDIGFSPSPWADLANFNKFTLTDYNFEVNREVWQHHYQAIARANQVVTYVPDIDMDAALRDRVVGEAKFIRALLYFNLLNLYENVPLITTVLLPEDRPATASPAQLYTQIEKDLTEAIPVLPGSYDNANRGRATKGAAQALLGKVQLQQRKFSA
jgi:starch-binding outer membrane protein, SusD/RagB family